MDYFKKTLADFTFQVASKGAICHLQDLGYTPREIQKKLDFPTPFERVQSAVWEHLLENGTILSEEPGCETVVEKARYVHEFDEYGKASFRRVVEEKKEVSPINWTVQEIAPEEALTWFREKRKQAEAEKEKTYAQIDFGLVFYRDRKRFDAMAETLDQREKAYFLELPWERRRLYHKMTPVMVAVLERLIEHGYFCGNLYFCSEKNIYKLG